MASNPVVIHVRPDGGTWHVSKGESPWLVLRSKQTAVDEAHVQAMLSQPSRVVVYAADGTVEGQATYPDGLDVDGVSADRSGTRAHTGETV